MVVGKAGNQRQSTLGCLPISVCFRSLAWPLRLGIRIGWVADTQLDRIRLRMGFHPSLVRFEPPRVLVPHPFFISFVVEKTVALVSVFSLPFHFRPPPFLLPRKFDIRSSAPWLQHIIHYGHHDFLCNWYATTGLQLRSRGGYEGLTQSFYHGVSLWTNKLLSNFSQIFPLNL